GTGCGGVDEIQTGRSGNVPQMHAAGGSRRLRDAAHRDRRERERRESRARGPHFRIAAHSSCETIPHISRPPAMHDEEGVMRAWLHVIARGATAATLAAIPIALTLRAQPPAPAPLHVAARTLPVPTTVSPEMQAIVGAPLSATWNMIPKS